MKLIAIDNVNIGDVYLSATMSLNRSCNGFQTIIVRLQSIHAKPKIIENPNKESKKKQRVQAEVKETA